MANHERIKLPIVLNYKFRKPDPRDYKLVVSPSNNSTKATVTIFNVVNPTSINVLNQGNIGSCVSNSFSQYISMMTSKNVNISRLMHYYCGRSIEGSSSTEDTGLDIRQAAKIISRYGAVAETHWPYLTSNFSILPPLNVFQKSLYFKKYIYTFVNQDINSIKNVLNVIKLPIIFGIMVYDSFMTNSVANTGIIPMPNVNTETLQGGHCIVMIGYNDTTQMFLCVNSWGISWGQKGLFYIPYAYVLSKTLSADLCYLTFIYS